MFKKPKRNFRSQRKNSESEEDGKTGDKDKDDEEVIECNNIAASSTTIVPPPVTKKAKKKKDKQVKELSSENGSLAAGSKLTKVSSTSSILSFEEDDGDGEIFQIKKSSHSRRIAKQLKRESRKEKEDQEKDKQTYTDYSVEGLKALQKLQEEQNLNNVPVPMDMELGSDVEGDSEQPSKGKANSSKKEAQEDSDKPPAKEGSQGSDGQEDEDEEESDVWQEGDDNRPRKKRDVLSGSRVQELLASGQIPDAALIHLARKKRQRAREKGGDDFVPLDDTEKFEKNTSRLIREDDNDHSDEEDEDGRICFTVASKEQELRKIQSTILEAEQGSHSEGSDQEREWEEQQIRKGVQVSAPQPSGGEYADGYQQYLFGQSASSYPSSAAYKGLGAAKDGKELITSSSRGVPTKDLPQITLQIISKRLKERLDDLGGVHRAHIHERDDIETRTETSQCDIVDHSGQKDDLESRYRFFQEMRGYVRDLVECLNEKVGSINYMERCMMKLWRTRAEKLVRRRQEDIKDQAADFMSSKAAVAPNLAGMEVSTEEASKQRRVAEREARRARRKRARGTLGVKDHNDGLSTDDEEAQSEIVSFVRERDRLATDSATVFDDVTEDFHQFDQIKSRFEDWKLLHGDTYQEAYIGLCLPKLFTPLVRLKLIDWNPLQGDCWDFEETGWFESLMFYCYKDVEEDGLPDDGDLMLVPTLVEKVLLPKLTDLVESVWDPMSSSQTRRLTSFVKRLTKEYPTVSSGSKSTQGMIKTLAQRMRKTLDDDVFMPLYPKQMLENKSLGASMFFHRQFWSCMKLLGNMLMWHGVLSHRLLQELTLDCLLNRYMMLALHNSAVNTDSINKCQAITSTFPRDWFLERDADSTIPQLEPLCRYLLLAANTVNNEGNKSIAKEGVRQIRKMLVMIHAMDHASNLAELSCLKS